MCFFIATSNDKNLMVYIIVSMDFPTLPHHGGSDGKESACNVEDPGSIFLGSGKFPGKGNGNSLQYSCLENSMNR